MVIWSGLGGHTLKNVGKMPNSWTDWEHILHTYADPPACEWIYLDTKLASRHPEGHRGRGLGVTY